MKAVVVELKKDKAAVLSDDGCIVTLKNNNYEIGQVIQMRSPKIHFSKKIAAFAASAAVFVLLGVGGYAYASPYTYVSLDVNPSIEFSVNRFDRVLKVKAVNDDGEEILQDISLDNLENKTIYEALTTSVKQISESGYFDGDIEGGIVIATSGEDMDKAEDLAKDLQESVENETSELGKEVNVETISVGLERVNEAKELGVTPGKLNLVEKLQAAAEDPSSIKIEEWLNKPVKEIMKATKDFKKAAKVDKEEIETAEDVQETSDEELDVLVNEEDNDQDDDNDIEESENKVEKATKAAEKAMEKAKQAEEKAAEKAKKAEVKAKKLQLASDKDEKEAAKKAKELAEKESKEANKALEKAKEAADKAQEKADKALEEATKAAEKAKKEADKAIEKSNDKAEASYQINTNEDKDEYTDDADEDENNNDDDNKGQSMNYNNNDNRGNSKGNDRD